MNIAERIKIMLMIKRFSYKELEVIKSMIDDEFKKRNKNLLKHK